MKTFKVSIKIGDEVDADNMNDAFLIACKKFLHDVGVTNVTDEVLGKMEERVIYTVTGKKE